MANLTKDQITNLLNKHYGDRTVFWTRQILVENIAFLQDLADLLKCKIPPEKLIELAIPLGMQSMFDA